MKINVAAILLSFVIITGSVPAGAQSIMIPADSAKGPMCIVIDSAHRVAVPLSPNKSQYNVVITDGIAQVKLSQMFVNDYGVIKDIVYVFPLPHEAAVHAMAMEYKGKLYSAEIYEKQDAQAKYDSVVQSGGNAALLLQDRPNVFQQRLANIAFHDTAWISIELSMPLSYNNGTFEFALPTMVAERYQSQNASTVLSSGTGWNPPPNRDGQSLDINVLVQTGFPVTHLTSPTHDIAVSSIDEVKSELVNRQVIRGETVLSMPYSSGVLLQKVSTYPNKDFVLRFDRAGAGMDMTAASYYDTTLKTGYFYANIFPDTGLFSGERPKLDIVILIDISGSQGGWPLAKEKEIANKILDNLTSEDRFTVLSFESSVSWCFGKASVVATEENIGKARTFINGLAASGGTNLLAGIKEALEIGAGNAYSRFFVFLTDGQITNEDAIFTAIREHPTAPTIFTFGAGNNLNRYFLDEAAKVGNGVSTEITENENVPPIVESVWNKIESPQLANVTVTCAGLDRQQLLFPNGTMLYKGSPVTMFGVYDQGGTRTVTITGIRNGETVTLAKELTLASVPNANTMIPRIWAKQMISKLRLEEGTGTKNKNHIIELSKQYQVLSDYTAFLAINPVDVTEDNSISGGMVSAVIDKSAVGLGRAVMVHQTSEILEIELAAGNSLLELTIYDISGRCMIRVPVSLRQRCHRFLWDRLFTNGKKLARGHYILKIRTTQGLITRHLFLT